MTISDHIVHLSRAIATMKGGASFVSAYETSADQRLDTICAFQRLLLSSVADLCMQYLGGNLVEIGAAQGDTTVVLAATAQRHGRRVMVVDPYNGQQEGTAALFSRFAAQIAPFGATVEHVRDQSQSPPSITQMTQFGASLVFVDGLHEVEAAYRDILTAYEALPIGGIVCVDDTNMLAQGAGAAMRRALDQGLFTVVPVDATTQESLSRNKSWHWGVKTAA